jgi:hypothetical protein
MLTSGWKEFIRVPEQFQESASLRALRDLLGFFALPVLNRRMGAVTGFSSTTLLQKSKANL